MKTIRVSAPGSMMLFGEHAVLRGHPALVCAINRRVYVTLAPRADRTVLIRSELGQYEGTIETLTAPSPLPFVTASLSAHKDRLPTGFDLNVQSEIHHKAGLGSSAAVTVATQGAVSMWLERRWDTDEILKRSIAVIRAVQGVGSGADAAASVLGGIVRYRMDPLEIRKLNAVHGITIVYSGAKKATSEVVRLVNEARERQQELFDGIFALMGKCTEKAVEAIDRGDWGTVGQLMNIHHGLMDAIGVCDGKLAGIVYALRRAPGILGAKISGSGLGDCVIGLGGARAEAFSYDQLPTAMATEGLREETTEPGTPPK